MEKRAVQRGWVTKETILSAVSVEIVAEFKGLLNEWAKSRCKEGIL